MLGQADWFVPEPVFVAVVPTAAGLAAEKLGDAEPMVIETFAIPEIVSKYTIATKFCYVFLPLKLKRSTVIMQKQLKTRTC